MNRINRHLFKIITLIFIGVIIASCTRLTPKADFDFNKNSWQFMGYGPEWRITIDNDRFTGSFIGLLYDRIVEWDKKTEGDTFVIQAKNDMITLKVKQNSCFLKDVEYPYEVTVNFQGKTYEGCFLQ